MSGTGIWKMVSSVERADSAKAWMWGGRTVQTLRKTLKSMALLTVRLQMQ